MIGSHSLIIIRVLKCNYSSQYMPAVLLYQGEDVTRVNDLIFTTLPNLGASLKS